MVAVEGEEGCGGEVVAVEGEEGCGGKDLEGVEQAGAFTAFLSKPRESFSNQFEMFAILILSTFGIVITFLQPHHYMTQTNHTNISHTTPHQPHHTTPHHTTPHHTNPTNHTTPHHATPPHYITPHHINHTTPHQPHQPQPSSRAAEA